MLPCWLGLAFGLARDPGSAESYGVERAMIHQQVRSCSRMLCTEYGVQSYKKRNDWGVCAAKIRLSFLLVFLASWLTNMNAKAATTSKLVWVGPLTSPGPSRTQEAEGCQQHPRPLFWFPINRHKAQGTKVSRIFRQGLLPRNLAHLAL